MSELVIEWDGVEVPEALRRLPPGQYVLHPVDDGAELTPEEEDGILEALDSLERGEGVPAAEVFAELRASPPR